MSALKFCKDCKHSTVPDRLNSLRCLHDAVNADNSGYLASGDPEEARYASCGRAGKSWRVSCGPRGKLWEAKSDA